MEAHRFAAMGATENDFFCVLVDASASFLTKRCGRWAQRWVVRRRRGFSNIAAEDPGGRGVPGRAPDPGKGKVYAGGRQSSEHPDRDG